MLGIIEFALLCVFVFFYAGLFYNLPVLAAGVRDVFRNKRKSKKTSVGDEVLPSISIVLPVKNEESVIGRLLGALSNMRYPTEKMEIVIVDDGSIDGTAEICRRFAGEFGNVRYLQRSVSSGKASALNYGMTYCHGEIIGVFDADNVLAEDAFLNVANYFRDSKVAAVQGRIHSINSNENMLTQFIAYEDAVWSEAFLRGKEVLGLFVHLRGCCEFIRRNVLEEMGGFDEGTLAEDIEISARLTGQGYRIKYAPDVRAWQESPAALKPFLKQRTRWFRGHMEVAFKYGRLMRHLNKRTVDAEFTLFLPLVAIASMFSYSVASWAVLSALPVDSLLRMFMNFSTVATSALILLCGFALVYISKPRRVRSLLWLPFVFTYWCLESFLALYAGMLIVLRRPRNWVKTEKSGAVASPEFTLEIRREVD
jgi:cellulose synthase/poly-beta-1,6-N-acetylglucosamine synthase-like glycosyltransferase